MLAVHTFAQVVTTDLVVRSAPGTGQDSEIYGTIADIGVYVLDGPVHVDGHEWWLVVPDSYGQLGADFEGGWVAAGSQSEVWLAPASRRCEPAPTSDELWAMPRTQWVGCYAGTPVTLRGLLMGCVQDALGNSCYLRYCPPEVADACALTDGLSVLAVFDSLPSRSDGQVAITGHFGDFSFAAERCGAQAHSDVAPLAEFRCATFLVAASARFVD